MQAENIPVEVQVPRTAPEFKALAQRVLLEEEPRTIHTLADALATGVLTADHLGLR